MKVRGFLEELLGLFPLDDAEEWDRPGLTVGDPEEEVTGVLCALDPSPEAVDEARSRGANVLLTHHPAFLSPPAALTPEPRDSSLAGALLHRAASSGVSLIGLHTNLDRSPRSLAYFADLLDLPYLGAATAEGYGALLDASGLTADGLGERLRRRLGARPLIWGDGSEPISRAAYLSGSMGDLGARAVAAGADAIVTGEGSYHRVLELVTTKDNRNVNPKVIIIGHDVSERPYAGLLRDVAADILGPVPIGTFEEPLRWHPLEG